MDELSTQANNLVISHPYPMDQNPAAVYLAGLAPTGRRSQQQALAVIAGILTAGKNSDPFMIEWALLRFQHTAAIRSKLVDSTYSPATANKMLSALRGVLKAAWRLGQMGSDDYARAADVANVNGSTVPAGRELTEGEKRALMTACENDPTPAGVRDAAIIAMMLTAGGPRREEIVNLSLASYDPLTGVLVIQGKRNKERTAYLVNGAREALEDWLIVRGKDGDPLFCAINKAGRLDYEVSMSSQAVYNLLKKRGAQAGIADFSPHDMRRTYVSDLLAVGVDIATVSKMAGHSSVQTTARYDRRPEEAKRKASELLHIPYRKRSPVK